MHLENSESGGRHKYEITMVTGRRNQAGTSSKVYCILTGDRGATETISLKDPEMQRFQKCGVDSFMFRSQDHLGNLKSINVWHNNSGKQQSWYLKEIVVQDLTSDSAYYFPCDCWLAVEYGDGNVQRVLSPADSKDMKAFSQLFRNAARLTDSHLWLSVVTRPAKSNFTRVQRLTCCLAFVYCTMLINAMYYDVYGQTDPSSILVELGPFCISLRGVFVGIISSIVIFPMNLCFVQVFRTASPKEIKKKTPQTPSSTMKPAPIIEKENATGVLKWYKTQAVNDDDDDEPIDKMMASTESLQEYQSTLDLSATSSKPSILNESGASLDSDYGSTSLLYRDTCFLRESCREDIITNDTCGDCTVELGVEVSINENAADNVERRKRRLPHWCIYVAWLILLAVSSTAAFFVTLYGFQFGNDKASQWLASMLISLLQDAIVSQPFKVLFIALFVALVTRKPAYESTCNGSRREDNKDSDSEAESGAFSRFHRRIYRTQNPEGPPNEAELKKAREHRTREIHMRQIVKEVVLYVLFLVSLCLVSYSQRDPQAFLVARLMEDTYLGGAYTGFSLKQVSTRWRCTCSSSFLLHPLYLCATSFALLRFTKTSTQKNAIKMLAIPHRFRNPPPPPEFTRRLTFT